jgi:hypothetical protein
VRRTLVIGDVHGHIDRLATLLEQEGIIRDVGDGVWERIDFDTEVVQLGDLGHFGGSGGSPTGDMLCYEYADAWLDVVLWGNHDRAVFDESHTFRGYERPRPEVIHMMRALMASGKYQVAHEAHGWFLSHAGMHSSVRYNHLPDEQMKYDAEAMAQWLNSEDQLYLQDPDNIMNLDKNAVGIINAIGAVRGGGSRVGGILWRDISENLWMGFPQVFGHSADHKKHAVRYCWEKGSTRKFDNIPEGAFDKMDGKLSYCVDVGGRNDSGPSHCLAGVYLPEQKVVRVDLDPVPA